MIHLPSYFKQFLTLLKIEQVDYLLVGGYAVQYYGYLRATRDLDIWTAIDPENVRKVVEVCHDLGGGMIGLTPDLLEHANRIIRIEIPPLTVAILNPVIGQKPEIVRRLQGARTEQIEILTVQSGVSFGTCFMERVLDTIDGVEVNIISLHHLRAIKQAGARPTDMDDLAHL